MDRLNWLGISKGSFVSIARDRMRLANHFVLMAFAGPFFDSGGSFLRGLKSIDKSKN